MMTKTQQLRFAPYSPEYTDIDCPDGQIEITDSTFAPDGSAGSRVVADNISHPHGTVVCIHDSRMILWCEGMLYWMPQLQSDEDETYPIGPASQPSGVAQRGNTLIIQHDSALHYYTWRFQGYDHTLQFPELPVIQFGLRADDRISGHAYERIDPSNPSMLHLYTEALKSQVYRHGDFTQPFFVRYALRDLYGRYIAASAPVLMLPTVLPPRLDLTSISTDDDGTMVQIDLSSNRKSHLYYKIDRPIDRQWSSLVQSVDIFVSPPINTYDEDSMAGYASTLGDIVRKVNNSAPHRGRDNAHLTESDDVFEGHYSVGDYDFTEQRLTSAQLHNPVWWVEPNHHLCHDIATCGDFYRVASIDLHELMFPNNQFNPVPIYNSSPEAIMSRRKLNDNECASIVPVPAAVTTIGDRIVAAGGDEMPVLPYRFDSMCAFAGDAETEADGNVHIEVYSRRSGELTAVHTSSKAFPADLRQHFPRFIYHPDPEVHMMQIGYDGDVYQLALQKHETLAGVYWFGGLDIDHAPPVAETPVTVQSPLLVNALRPCGNTVSVSLADNLHIFPRDRRIRVGTSRIITVAGALKPPGAGLFGRYPLYVFSDDGIYMLEYNQTTDTFASATMISRDTIRSPDSVCACREAVAYICDGRLKLLDGSKTATVADIRMMRPYDNATLSTMADTDTGGIDYARYTHGALAWLDSIGAIAIYGHDTPSCLIYFPDNKSMCTSSLAIERQIRGSDLLQLSDDSVVTCRIDRGNATTATRPLKLGTTDLKSLHSIMLWGAGDCAHSVRFAVYGSDHLDRWHLIGSSAKHYITVASKRRYRFFRIVATSTDTLTTARIKYT